MKSQQMVEGDEATEKKSGVFEQGFQSGLKTKVNLNDRGVSVKPCDFAGIQPWSGRRYVHKLNKDVNCNPRGVINLDYKVQPSC
jgi:hypothetical protein